ncbi:MAG: hypothetical protein JWN94_2586 [Betaproteobacteria bacterium]|nr:hypothetical protein [Betaproteobacteria bacterium]
MRQFTFLVLGVLAAGLLFPAASLASCPEHRYADPADVRLNGDAVMIVTHASSNDDGRIASKFGVDEAIHFAKKNRIPIVYLQDDRKADNYFMADCTPDYWIFSKDGEIKFDVPPHVYLAGGHLELCLSVTVNDILMKWAKRPRGNLILSYFMDGIFSNGRNIEESDPYYNDYLRFMGIVNYSRPAGEYFPKLTLLETMGIIINETRQYDYLKRILPHYERSLPADYRVELAMSESRPKVLQAGKKLPDQTGRPPLLRFDFVDSADNLNYLKH